VKLDIEAAGFAREGVYHARLRRLGTEERCNKRQRSFESLYFITALLEKHDENLPC